MEEGTPKKDLFLPISILIAAFLISVSLVYRTGKTPSVKNENLAGSLEQAVSPENLRPVSKDDHILGNLDAPVKIIEFSDLECPFCKSFHPEMKKALKVYDGKIAWVYRHFPLDQIHPKARKEAEATECAAELGGNDAFWAYVDKVFEVTPSNNGLDLNLLPKIAEEIGLDQTKFKTCLESGRHQAKVAADLKDALGAGARGTPYPIVIGRSGVKLIIPGALPFEPDPMRPELTPFRPIIDQALKS